MLNKDAAADSQDKPPTADDGTGAGAGSLDKPPAISNRDAAADFQDKPPVMLNRDAAAEAIIGLAAKSVTIMAHGAINKDIVEDDVADDKKTTTNVGVSVAIGDNPPFAIYGAATNEIENTNENPNVKDGGDRHIDDGDESIASDNCTKDDRVLDADIPRKRPSRSMAPEPEVANISKRKSLSWLYIHIVFISIIPTRTIEMRI
jgi:hypothetical protein